MIKIFSVIVTYNGLKWYDRCFGSLQNSSIPVSVVVVDNGSTDGTVDYIRCRYPEIVVLQQNENLGFAKANNVGMRYAMDHGADYVFLLNQDAWINERNTISELIRISQENPRYYILSPLQLLAGSGRLDGSYFFAVDANPNSDYMSDLYNGTLKDCYDLSFICAACWLLPIQTIVRIGGFDPIYFHYGEDDNYIHRVFYHGGKIGICPKVSFSHDKEYRPSDYTGEYTNWKKRFLVNIGNVNLPFQVKSTIKSKKKQMLFLFFRLQFKELMKEYSEYRYIKEIGPRVEYNRLINGQVSSCWL